MLFVDAIKYNKRKVERSLVFTFSVLLFIYTFLPFRFWKLFNFSGQIEPLVIITTLSSVLRPFILYSDKFRHG
jgi:hypothetical protein